MLPRLVKFQRRKLAAVFLGAGFGSFGYGWYLWSAFMRTQPRTPDPAAGLIYAMNNHGWIYYLSAVQSTELGMLLWAFIAFAVGAAAAHGPVPKKEAWERFSASEELPWKLFAASLLLTVIALWLAGASIAQFLVFRGIVLGPW